MEWIVNANHLRLPINTALVECIRFKREYLNNFAFSLLHHHRTESNLSFSFIISYTCSVHWRRKRQDVIGTYRTSRTERVHSAMKIRRHRLAVSWDRRRHNKGNPPPPRPRPLHPPRSSEFHRRPGGTVSDPNRKTWVEVAAAPTATAGIIRTRQTTEMAAAAAAAPVAAGTPSPRWSPIDSDLRLRLIRSLPKALRLRAWCWGIASLDGEFKNQGFLLEVEFSDKIGRGQWGCGWWWPRHSVGKLDRLNNRIGATYKEFPFWFIIFNR